MSSMKVLNMAGAEVGTVELNDEIFGITPNPVAVHEVVKNHLANCRQGTQSALTRAEFPAVAVSPGARRVPATPVRALPVLLSGRTAVSCSLPSPAITAMC